ncbi:MAG: HXXEE domain-containing protein [Candidatus Cloacimonetes bacterium]|nr:HXXEE domain-containing protein [Candidatus Cloacimonadota bacterium]
MNSKNKIVFLILVIVQGLHSVEEYIGKFWEIFPPARFIDSLISENLETGFIIINIGFFIFGIWCWFFPVLRNYNYARRIIWFWIVIEMINGIGHSFWALYEREYVPGIVTALILLILSIYLMRQLLSINSMVNEKNISLKKQ